MKRKMVALALLLLLISATIPVTAFATAQTYCDRFVSCSGPADCAWWGVRCAVSDPWLFGEIVNDVWW